MIDLFLLSSGLMNRTPLFPIIFLIAFFLYSAPTPIISQTRPDREKAALYQKFIALSKSKTAAQRKQAYETGKEYLTRYDAAKDAHTESVRLYIREYEIRSLTADLNKAFKEGNYAMVILVGDQILKTDPDNFSVLMNMVYAAYATAINGDKSLNEKGMTLALKANSLISKKSQDPAPWKSIPEVQTFIQYAAGVFALEPNPVESARALLSVAHSKTFYKDSPLVYYYLGMAVLKGEWHTLFEANEKKYGGQGDSVERRRDEEKALLIANRAIEYLARGVALAKGPDNEQTRKRLLDEMTSVYKIFHNGSDAGLTELVNTVLTKPLP
jgi:hypothetical protein